MILHLDYETRSQLLLDERGLDNYARDPSTRILLCAYAFDDLKPKLWQPHLTPQIPSDLEEALLDPFVEAHAWNASFERAITRCVLGIDKPLEEWRDPMANARYLSLPGSLDTVGEILGLPEGQAKIKDGKRLIRLFCEPEDQGGENTLFGQSEPTFRDWETDPKDWKLFGEYCVQDVIAERANENKLLKFPLPDAEWDTWRLSERINERGIPVSLHLVSGARVIVNREMERLTDQLKEITKLDNPGSTQQLLGWLEGQGYHFSSIGKAFVARALGGECALTEEAKLVLAIRGQTAKSSVKKYTAIADTTSADGRLRHAYQFMGAARTGRFSSLGANLANLAKASKAVEKNMDRAIELVQKMDYDTIVSEFGKPLDVATSTIRSSFRASDGERFVIADAGAIENRVLGWVSRCDKILDVFRKTFTYEGEDHPEIGEHGIYKGDTFAWDPYLDFATRMYGGTYAELWYEWKILGDATKRTNSKPAVLGCFGGGTLVLTQRGWVPICSVEITDLVWDGVDWVKHSGSVYRGTKKTIDLFGVESTPDHLILTKEGVWKSSKEVTQNGLYAKSATNLAIGLLPGRVSLSTNKDTIRAVAEGAEKRNRSTVGISKKAKLSPASCAPTNVFWKRRAAYMSPSRNFRGKWLTVSPIDIMPSFRGVAESESRRTATRAVELSANSRTYMTSWVTASPLRTAKTRSIRLIESTTTAITPKEIFDSSHLQSTTATKRFYNTLYGTAKRCVQKNFGNGSARNTESPALFAANCAKEFPQSKSLLSKQTVGVPTFDILNAGPLNRFTILTNFGPLIVHNCGFQLGAGKEAVDNDGNRIWTGLLGYGRALGVEMSEEDAKHSIQVFRETYTEVVWYWKDIHRAAVRAIRHPGEVIGVGVPYTDKDREYYQRIGHPLDWEPRVSFLCHGKKVLEMILPSGRSIHYINPVVREEDAVWEGREYKKISVYYEGKEQGSQAWGECVASPGRFTENSVQAIARDLLVYGMKLADAEGFPIVLHTYDEIGAVVPYSSSLGLPQLIGCMEVSPPWCLDLPLAADGKESVYYAK